MVEPAGPPVTEEITLEHVVPLVSPEYLQPVEYAGFWLRFFAWFIDICLLAFIKISLAGWDYVTGLGKSDKIYWGLDIAIFLMYWIYFCLFECSRLQATIGKMAVGIIVIDCRGKRISFARATGRFFAKFLSTLILMIGFFMAAFTAKKQALHDMLADTLVVKR
jgi:uncharacterized RDD family membrane protein YckC